MVNFDPWATMVEDKDWEKHACIVDFHSIPIRFRPHVISDFSPQRNGTEFRITGMILGALTRSYIISNNAVHYFKFTIPALLYPGKWMTGAPSEYIMPSYLVVRKALKGHHLFV